MSPPETSIRASGGQMGGPAGRSQYQLGEGGGPSIPTWQGRGGFLSKTRRERGAWACLDPGWTSPFLKPGRGRGQYRGGRGQYSEGGVIFCGGVTSSITITIIIIISIFLVLLCALPFFCCRMSSFPDSPVFLGHHYCHHHHYRHHHHGERACLCFFAISHIHNHP